MCESMFKPRAFRSSCRLRVGGRGYNNRTVFFSPRRVGSIGRDRAQILVIPTRRIEILCKSGKFSSDSSIYFHPRPPWKNPLALFFFYPLITRATLSSFAHVSSALLLRPSSVLPPPLVFAFNHIILTRLCFIRAARSVCSGITSTQGKKNQTSMKLD